MEFDKAIGSRWMFSLHATPEIYLAQPDRIDPINCFSCSRESLMVERRCVIQIEETLLKKLIELYAPDYEQRIIYADVVVSRSGCWYCREDGSTDHLIYAAGLTIMTDEPFGIMRVFYVSNRPSVLHRSVVE